MRCRGEVVLSTWNACSRRSAASSPTRRAPAARAAATSALLGNKVVESYVEQAIFSTPGVGAGEQARLRRLRRASTASRCAARGVQTLPNPAARARCSASARCCRPAIRRSGAARRRRSSCRSRCRCRRSTRPRAARRRDALSAPPPSPRSRRTTRTPAPTSSTDTLRHTPFDAIQRRMGGTFAEWEGWDWISDFGDAVAEHHAVRETVGMWDESPLQKWLFRGPDALAAADYCFTSDMAAPRGRPGALRRVLRRARQDARRRHGLQHRRQREGHPRRHRAPDRRRPLPQRGRRQGPRRRGRRAHRRAAAPAAAGPAARASCWARSPTPTSARCATSGSSRTSRSAACPAA